MKMQNEVFLIDAKALRHDINIMPEHHLDADEKLYVYDVIMRQPIIDAVPVVHGQWLTLSDIPDTLICSACGRRFDMYFFDQKDMPYCLCGCKMDGGAEE